MSFWKYWRGRWRLHFGWCPECNSSPPRLFCPVCQGSHKYGTHDENAPLRIDRWRRIWESRR